MNYERYYISYILCQSVTNCASVYICSSHKNPCSKTKELHYKKLGETLTYITSTTNMNLTTPHMLNPSDYFTKRAKVINITNIHSTNISFLSPVQSVKLTILIIYINISDIVYFLYNLSKFP